MIPKAVAEVVEGEIFLLDRLIREADSLSEPCPLGRWRWADVKHSGYGKKSEDELAADRERNRLRAINLRGRRATLRLWLCDQVVVG